MHHLVTLLFFVDQLIVEKLIDVRDWLIDLAYHLFELALEFRHDLVGHCLLEFMMDYLTDLLISQRC